MRFQVTDKVRRKLKIKHNVEIYEVEEALEDKDILKRRAGGSRRRKEFKYAYFGRTHSGRLLKVILIFKPGGAWLVTALDGDRSDFRAYNAGND